jgi:hypothetical protein
MEMHCKKSFSIFPSPAGIYQTLAGQEYFIYDVIIAAQEEFGK